LREVFCFKVKVTSYDQIKFRNERNWWADLRLLHPTLINVAKMPEQITLLLKIGSGVFLFGEMEVK